MFFGTLSISYIYRYFLVCMKLTLFVRIPRVQNISRRGSEFRGLGGGGFRRKQAASAEVVAFGGRRRRHM